MTRPPPTPSRQLAAEIFLTAAGPALVKRVADTLQPHGIPVMPLKGVLLQKVVYGPSVFRPISDVDLLVPEDFFFQAFAKLRAAGFTEVRWEVGKWQVTLRDPNGPPLAVDLHRRLTRTVRSRLTSRGLFERGLANSSLFGAPVTLPSSSDLFAHLLLHAALHWVATGSQHRPEDFQALPRAPALAFDATLCAQHLTVEGLTVHGLVVLPMVLATGNSSFVAEVLTLLQARATRRQRLAADLVRTLCSGAPAHHWARRLASLALAPSLTTALASAGRDRAFRPSTT